MGDLAEFGELQRRIEQGERTTPPPSWVEMPEPKNNGQRIWENGGGAGRIGSSEENLGRKRKAEEERNLDVDPRLRVMERFR